MKNQNLNPTPFFTKSSTRITNESGENMENLHFYMLWILIKKREVIGNMIEGFEVSEVCMVIMFHFSSLSVSTRFIQITESL